MLYMDFGKNEGQWVPNIYGGSENLEGVEFIKHFNSILHKMYPGVLTIAKETSAWPKITESLEQDGLGFDYAWNIGFMNDFVSYLKKPYDERMTALRDLTFSMVYAYSENYILAVSHNEVYRNGGSLLDCIKMEEEWKKPFLRALYAYMMCHPGKKMLYMNQEVDELICKMNQLYKELPALSKLDTVADGFEWINCIDHNDGTLSFIRKSGSMEEKLLVVANFSKNHYENYKLGVADEGKYQEIFNSNIKEAGGEAEVNPQVIATEEEYYDGRRFTIDIELAPMSVVMYSYRPFTKEELLEIAERKVALIRAQLEKEALEKAEAIKQVSLKENLESKVHEAREKILSGTEVEKEVKVIRKSRNTSAKAKNGAKKIAAETPKTDSAKTVLQESKSGGVKAKTTAKTQPAKDKKTDTAKKKTEVKTAAKSKDDSKKADSSEK